MNRIIYIKYSPLTKKVYDDYCMGVLLDHGYQVEYWDVTTMFGINLNTFESYTPQSLLVIVKINSYKDFNAKVSENEDALYISMMTCGIGQVRLLRILSRHHCRLAFWGPDPVCISSKSVWDKIRGITLKKVKTKMGYELVKFLFRIRFLHFYDYYFSVGKEGYKSLGVVVKSLLDTARAVSISSSDYNEYTYHNHDRLVEGNYIVFIDQYFPFHPDFLICGAPTVPAEVYYNSLNKFFNSVEKELQMRVVIAAHPKSLRYRDEDFFEKREVYFGATCSLVKNATLVLAHDSTAIGYAVMAKRPIALLTSSAMKKFLPEHVYFMESLSNRFSIPLEDMDEEIPSMNVKFSKLSDSQLKLYESYINEYCTSPSVNLPNEQVVLSFVRSILC